MNLPAVLPVLAATLQRIDDLVELSVLLDLHPLWDHQLVQNLRAIQRLAAAAKRDLEGVRDSR